MLEPGGVRLGRKLWTEFNELRSAGSALPGDLPQNEYGKMHSRAGGRSGSHVTITWKERGQHEVRELDGQALVDPSHIEVRS